MYDGLRICVSWFEKVLEGTATSHNLGSNQAHTGKLTARGSKSASDLRKKLLETFDEIERKTASHNRMDSHHQMSDRSSSNIMMANMAASTGAKAAGQAGSKLTKEAMQAQKVFKAANAQMSQQKRQQ